MSGCSAAAGARKVGPSYSPHLLRFRLTLSKTALWCGFLACGGRMRARGLGLVGWAAIEHVCDGLQCKC